MAQPRWMLARGILGNGRTRGVSFRPFPNSSGWWLLSSSSSLVTKSCPTLATPGTVARQALLSMGFSRQEYWSGLPFPSPGGRPDLGIKQKSNTSLLGLLPWQADFLPLSHQGSPLRQQKRKKNFFLKKEKGEWLHFAYSIPSLKQ